MGRPTELLYLGASRLSQVALLIITAAHISYVIAMAVMLACDAPSDLHLYTRGILPVTFGVLTLVNILYAIEYRNTKKWVQRNTGLTLTTLYWCVRAKVPSEAFVLSSTIQWARIQESLVSLEQLKWRPLPLGHMRDKL